MDKSKTYDIKLKYIILGDAGVGKTSIIKRQSEDIFSNTYMSTIGVDYINIKINNQDYNLNIAVWDTAGQEKFKNIVNVYYRGITAALIVYDITDINTFNNVESWIKEIKDSSPNCYIMIVGNKTDLAENRQVYSEHINSIEEIKNGTYQHIECSSKQNHNIEDIFTSLSNKLCDELKNNKIQSTDSNGIQIYENNARISTFKITEPLTVKNKKGCCFIL